MSEQKVSIDTSDLTVDTTEKSLIKINSTSYNVYDNWFDFVRKYFGIDDLEDPFINTLKASFFGYFNEIASSEIKNAVFHRNFLYDEHFLNTAILPESIYNFAKQYNVAIENAVPASLYISISFIEKELVSSALLQEQNKNTITNANANTLKVYNLTFDRNANFSVSNYNFLLPYPLIISIQEIDDGEGGKTYSYSAMYDINANSFPPLESDGLNPYLKVWRETIDGVDRLFIGCQIFQITKSRKEFTITTTTDNPETLYHNVDFSDQLSYFEAFYEYNGETIPINLYFNNIYTPTEEEYYGYFTYLNDNTLQISFSSNSNAFHPVSGSTLFVDCYTTLGFDGNFEYNGDVSIDLFNNTTFSKLNITCTTIGNGSSNGKDKLDTIGQKTKILEAITTRNNIITDNDLNKFFDSLNESLNINGSKIKFIKKQDDVIKRIYCNFLLLRDENQRILPTNTAPHIRIPVSDVIIPDNNEKSLGVIKEHSIVTCNYIRDIQEFYNNLVTTERENYEPYFDFKNNIRLSQEYINYTVNNNYFQDMIDDLNENLNEDNQIENDINYLEELMKILECDSDLLVYSIPFLISIQTEPFLSATYYNVDINQEYNMTYEYLNTKMGASFDISNIKIEKDINPKASNKYTLDSNIYKLSFNLNTNLDYKTLSDKVIIKCNVYDKDCENNYGYFFFKLSDVESDDSNNINSFNYKYTAELSTDYKFHNNKLNLYNSLYNTNDEKTWLARDVFVNENLTLRIGILYQDENLAKSQTDIERKDFDVNIPEAYFSNIDFNNIKTELITENSNKTFTKCDNNCDLMSVAYKLDETTIQENPDIKSIFTSPIPLLPIPTSYTNFTSDYNTIFQNNDVYYHISYLTSSAFTDNDNSLISSFKNYQKLEINLLDQNVKNGIVNMSGDIKLLLKNIEIEGIMYNFELVYDFSFNNEKNEYINTSYDEENNCIIISIGDILSYDYLKEVHIISNEILEKDNISIYIRDNEDIKDTLYMQYLLNIINSTKVINANIATIIEHYSSIGSYELPTVKSVGFKLTDIDFEIEENEKMNINNYCLAAIIKNSDDIKLYQNMNSLMNSIITYVEETDEYDIELVPLIGLRYYMARPNTFYNLLNKCINFVDANLPRLENNTNCDIKFYNTYGPSRYFYFNKQTITNNIFIDNETQEEVSDISGKNPYQLSMITKSNTKYNYLGRTDVILDFDIYLYENITSEKDEEIKKYISDYVEECNTELILPISNLITLLQNNFNIIKYIKYNGIFSDVLNNNDTSKGNDYQLIDNDFNFNEMSKEEIRVYVPEYLNLKKDVVKSDDNFNYTTYDYVIKITYKV